MEVAIAIAKAELEDRWPGLQLAVPAMHPAVIGADSAPGPMAAAASHTVTVTSQIGASAETAAGDFSASDERQEAKK